ncbi:hypothetical protein [Prescottella agglutinans]|uniref:Uncharacterized protein n=1 Tax=Prescottella agglutinans TaxID=1644129 RepID=A0ABT6MET7_9NOCA|nr:hypothetical protein [Prescottella agglutinans]MDH6282828.1 hypothetical protein [Prescottella agglutinans]
MTNVLLAENLTDGRIWLESRKPAGHWIIATVRIWETRLRGITISELAVTPRLQQHPKYREMKRSAEMRLSRPNLNARNTHQ